MRFRSILIAVFAAMGLTISLVGAAPGAVLTWTNSLGNLSWSSTASNWSGAAWTAGSDAFFGSTGTGAIAVTGSQSVGNMTFNGAGYTLNSGADYQVQAGSVAANLAGNVNLVKSTGGMVTVSTACTYTGATVVSGGTLRLQAQSALPAGTVAYYSFSNSG